MFSAFEPDASVHSNVLWHGFVFLVQIHRAVNLENTEGGSQEFLIPSWRGRETPSEHQFKLCDKTGIRQHGSSHTNCPKGIGVQKSSPLPREPSHRVPRSDPVQCRSVVKVLIRRQHDRVWDDIGRGTRRRVSVGFASLTTCGYGRPLNRSLPSPLGERIRRFVSL